MSREPIDFDPSRTDASGLHVGIVAARFNGVVVDRLLLGALDALDQVGAARTDIEIVRVPGAFELPVALAALARTGRCDALVALGAVVRGDTPHFDFVAGEAAQGCGWVARRFGVPVGFGVLTTDTWEQATARAGGDLGNKGAEAALSAVETANVLRDLRGG